MTPPRRALAALVLLYAALVLGASALAQSLTLDVDPTGGPLVLEDRVTAALDAWRDAGLDVDAIHRSVRIRYAEATLLGPDVPVLIATTEDPAYDVDLLVHPDLLDRYPGALVYALGVAMGGAAGEGALDRRQEPGVVTAPTAADVAEIEAERAADPADLNRDGVVDFEDLLILTQRFGERGVNLPGDLDGDGVIDEADLELMRERYTFTPLRATPGPPPGPVAPDALPEVPAPIPADDLTDEGIDDDFDLDDFEDDAFEDEDEDLDDED